MPIIALAADHAGYALKETLKAWLAENHKEFTVLDLGTDSEERVDYPDFGHKAANALLEGKAEIGLIVCGSGIGISIAANRHPGIRAALCWNPEVAALARQHNDANILALGARLIDEQTAKDCLDTFLETPFDGGRHTDRVKKLG